MPRKKLNPEPTAESSSANKKSRPKTEESEKKPRSTRAISKAVVETTAAPDQKVEPKQSRVRRSPAKSKTEEAPRPAEEAAAPVAAKTKSPSRRKKAEPAPEIIELEQIEDMPD